MIIYFLYQHFFGGHGPTLAHPDHYALMAFVLTNVYHQCHVAHAILRHSENESVFYSFLLAVYSVRMRMHVKFSPYQEIKLST